MTIRPFKTGACRGQGSLLPPRIEDYVGPDNPVRVIEAYVSLLDLAALGFRHADRDGGAGQPPYDPADLLKLYLYGYLNQVRSQCGGNVAAEGPGARLSGGPGPFQRNRPPPILLSPKVL